MAVDLTLVLAAINFPDYLRVSAAKVSDPGTEVFSTYINTPVSGYTLVIPNLDPDNYYIDFRDAPTNVALGTLVSQAFYNAQSGQFEYERRFYTIGALPSGVTSTQYILNDPYLMNRNVTGVFKEAFRYLKPTDEFVYDDALGEIQLPDGGPMTLADGEKFIVELKFNAGSSSPAVSAGLFAGTIVVTASSYTLLPGDKGKRHSCECGGVSQLINLCALSGLSTGDFFYFENKRGGSQIQTRLLAAGTDKIMFNGFNLAGGFLITEAWVNRGHSVYLRKEVISSVSYWEIILEYDGMKVGERMSSSLNSMANWIPEDGRLLDGDEYPGLWWWIANALASTSYIIDDTVVNPGYVHPTDKKGQFVIHSSLKKFRLPNFQNTYERGLKNFTTFGSDSERSIDYPGGFQNWKVGPHKHDDVPLKINDVDRGGGSSLFSIDNAAPSKNTGENIGIENRTENIGIIFCRHI